METAGSQTLFHPYKVILESGSSLQLQPAMGQKAAILVLRLMPLIMLAIGIVMFFVQKEVFYLFIFGGIALLEGFIFSFIKIPGALFLDAMGFTLQVINVKGPSENYYLWNDVDYIRYRKVRAKNSTTLNYDAILKTGKRIHFLSFGNFAAKQNLLPDINSALVRISGKQVLDK